MAARLFPAPPALIVALAVCTGACASGRGRAAVVDLQPARTALAAARDAGAPKHAASSYKAAEAQLRKAEDLARRRGREAPQEAVRAEWMARLAATEANCATRTAGMRSELQGRSEGEVQRLQARLRRSEEEQRRLDERLAALQRDLEVTEMELIRTKARLKGLETKAEASSAIAEAHILLRRAEGTGGALHSLGQQSLSKAEQQLREENFGAAVFFALKAQDLATRAHGGPEASPSPQAAPFPLRVVVRAGRANLRKGPGPNEAVVAQVRKGTALAVKSAQGDWLEVTHGRGTAWVARSVVE